MLCVEGKEESINTERIEEGEKIEDTREEEAGRRINTHAKTLFTLTHCAECARPKENGHQKGPREGRNGGA